jgi:hypothetical protein
VQVVATSTEDGRLRCDLRGEGTQQAGLADPGLTRHEHGATPAAAAGAKGVVEAPELDVPLPQHPTKDISVGTLLAGPRRGEPDAS